MSDQLKKLALLCVVFNSFAAELLGLPLVPPYSQASSVEQVLQGANYASAAAGILDDSGGNFVSMCSLSTRSKNGSSFNLSAN